MEIKDQIKFADTPKVLIKYLDEQMDELKHTQFIVILINTKREEKSGISSINNFMVSEL